MTLYDNQKQVVAEAFEILDKWSMVYLALRPRYGKTPISLTLATGETLFVTTKSAVSGVQKVINALGIQGVTVCTYGTIHKHIDIYETLIIDEAHSNISKYPEPSKSREKLDLVIEKNESIKIIWLSGTPSIESSSKLFHQLNVSPRHSFSKFKSFHEWFNPRGHYKDPTKGGGYGVYGLVKYTGSNRPAVNYDHTINFENKVNPIMIRRGEDESSVNIHVRNIEPPQHIADAISAIKTKSIYLTDKHAFVANGGASKLSKMHQLAGGTCINEKSEGIILDDFKAQLIALNHERSNCCVFYKYVAEKDLLMTYFREEDLYQIDSNCTGIDLSHYSEMVIYSLTWSGSTYTQVLNRLVNVNRKDKPSVYIYVTNESPDNKVFKAVSDKLDFNTKFLSK